MHLYLVERKGDTPSGEVAGMVVAAPSPQRARVEAVKHAGDVFSTAATSKVTDFGVGKGPVRVIFTSKG